jgi:hypothetical protein
MQRCFQEIDGQDRDRQHGAARLDGLANSGCLVDTHNTLSDLLVKSSSEWMAHAVAG